MPRKDPKPDPQRQLMIKVKACQRLVKEATYYTTEVEENEAKLQQMKDDNKDAYDIKKFQEVLAESQMMIPDSSSRRDKALDDLKEFVALLRKEEQGNTDLMECEWMVEASKILGEDKNTAKDGEEIGGGDDVEITAVDNLADGEAF
eukprot:CAMPEP_0183711646 /NCGR_PEP_ID=MMETSP0737-20130205/7115_1 /TAXON_ID=385413 /ORGANISM="Thalassiosira miniscula, Strain CCMP1093" /LENGTH=146 /DNA_ID=CAMNT_0025940213 /DNA_START=107 /DNA_END=547 /DNA_ORIENTATION=-